MTALLKIREPNYRKRRKYPKRRGEVFVAIWTSMQKPKNEVKEERKKKHNNKSRQDNI